MSVDLDQMGAELEKLKEKLGLRTLTITCHPTFFTAYLHYKNETISIGHGDSLKEALAEALADRAEWIRENRDEI